MADFMKRDSTFIAPMIDMPNPKNASGTVKVRKRGVVLFEQSWKAERAAISKDTGLEKIWHFDIQSNPTLHSNFHVKQEQSIKQKVPIHKTIRRHGQQLIFIV